MTPDQINKSIAELLGWTDVNFYEDNAGPGYWNGYPPSRIDVDKTGEWIIIKSDCHQFIPDYFSDLNACVEFENSLTHDFDLYCEFLFDITGIESPNDNPNLWYGSFKPLIQATAPQKCEAFLRTKSKYDNIKLDSY